MALGSERQAKDERVKPNRPIASYPSRIRMRIRVGVGVGLRSTPPRHTTAAVVDLTNEQVVGHAGRRPHRDAPVLAERHPAAQHHVRRVLCERRLVRVGVGVGVGVSGLGLGLLWLGAALARCKRLILDRLDGSDRTHALVSKGVGRGEQDRAVCQRTRQALRESPIAGTDLEHAQRSGGRARRGGRLSCVVRAVPVRGK